MNEDGSEEEESAVSIMTLLGRGDPPPHFVADHPFMFVIIDTHSKVLLFVGHVAKLTMPTQFSLKLSK